MPGQLTDVERRVYNYLIDFLAENTYQPSIREIAKQFKIKSTKTVSDLLQALAEKGYIQRDRARSRGVRLLGFAAAGGVQPIPYYGKVAAGDEPLLPEHREGSLTVDRRFLPAENCFALKVKGTSMEGRAILDGDFVLVAPTLTAKQGDIVAARVGEEAMIKTLAHAAPNVVLEPANPADRAVELRPGDDYAILGVVCGVFRPMFEAAPAQPFAPQAGEA